MAKFKSILENIEVVTAGRQRRCYHSRGHSIQKGDICLEVRDGQARKGYCVECGRRMIVLARGHLETVLQELTSRLPPSTTR